jgi:cytochrome P450
MISRYDDVIRLLQDERLSAQTPFGYTFRRTLTEAEQAAIEQIRPYIALSLLNMDPPAHTRQRSLLAEFFTPRHLERLRGRIQNIVDEMIDSIQPTGQLELIYQFAYPLLFNVIFEILGIPQEGRSLFQKGLSLVTEFNASADPALGQLEQFAQNLQEIEIYLKPLLAKRQKEPKGDLISVMVEAEKQGDLSEKEIYVLCVQLIFAAHETTANVIGNGMLALLQNPEQLERLESQPDLINVAVEEMLRYGGTSQFRPRIAREDIEIERKRIQKGQRVFLVLGSANYDEEHFPHPEDFDIERPKERSMTFGYGIHYCLGAPLARIELQVVVATLLRRLPGLRLAPTSIEWRPNFLLRGLKALPLVFEQLLPQRQL